VTIRKAAAPTPTGLGPPGGANGPAAVIRELARDLVRQNRILPDEAGRIEGALRDHDWTTLRTYIDLGLARSAEAAPESKAGVAVRGTPAPSPAVLPQVGDPQALPANPQALAPAATPVPGPGIAAAANLAADDSAAVGTLVRIVLHLCEALPRLSGDDEGFVERLAPIRALLGARLTSERLKEIETRIGALVDQEVQKQRNLHDARSSLKSMLSMVIGRLGTIGASTSRFHERVSVFQSELAGNPDPAALARIAAGMLCETDTVAKEIEESQKALAEARRKVESYELRVRSLEHELAQTSRMVQNDPLTHALNRRGLDEVFRIEASRSLRYRVPLTVVMIDLDDFKSINDSFGHAAGDRALIHFVTTAQAALRSTELIARTGGEEFVVIFPATGIRASVEAIRRLQNELARSAFAHESHQRVVTFSGGAAEWREGEALSDLLERADAAMYNAKHQGKNQVAVAA
jgi:diguanylate cyclase